MKTNSIKDLKSRLAELEDEIFDKGEEMLNDHEPFNERSGEWHKWQSRQSLLSDDLESLNAEKASIEAQISDIESIENSI
jgi:predicted  nucleic acid-binding Zn-ribbon protein